MEELPQDDPRGRRFSTAKYHVYVDWTTEEPYRPFYVGKGKAPRVRRQIRNKHHANVAAKYGLQRVIVLSTNDEALAFDEEIRLIAEHHTFVGDSTYNGIGCNYTKGGEGAAGHITSEETRHKLSIKNSMSMLGNKNFLGYRRSEIDRQRIADSLRGHDVSQETRLKISKALTGRSLSAEHVARSANSHRGTGKPVEQLNGDVIIATHRSAKLAQDVTGVNRSKICDCCKGKRQRAGGFGWRFSEERKA